jgi:hypothetical protein
VTRSLTPFVALALFALVPLASLRAAEPKEKVHLTITGGTNAGTYDAVTDRGGCSAGMTGPASWGNQFSLPKEKDPKKLNSVQLIVPNAKAAAGGTHDFFLNIGFGPLMQRAAEYKVDTAKKQGSGTLTIADKGATALVTFDATTAAGVKLHGTIDCMSVMRAGK